MNKVFFKSSSHFFKKANKVFQEQKARINKSLPYADIQHIGSTSIPESVTKGDLDIAVRVPVDKFNLAIEVMKNIYDVNQPDNWAENFASFKDEKSLGIDFGAQLVIINSSSDDFVKLNEVLRSDPNLITKYNKMKLKYEGKSMDEYRKEKAAFFQKLRETL